jgi:hypothetical protein
MLPVPTYLKNYQSVLDAFGYWPSFHDSPVTRFEVSDDTIHLELRAWEMTNQTDKNGYFIQTKHHEIGFRFKQIVSTSIDNFLPDNMFDLLGFTPLEDFERDRFFTVDLDSVLGSDLCGEFCAKVGEVTFSKPYSPN